MTTETENENLPPLDRDLLAPLLGPCIHRARSSGQADIFLIRSPGDNPPADNWLLKDFAARPLWMRLLVTRRALKREYKALRANQDIPGVPRVAGMVDADAMVIQRLDAERLPHLRDNFLTPEFFDRARAMVEAIHARGWAHGDLRRKNILADPRTLQPFLIDFATAWHAGPRAGPLRRFLLSRWRQVDLITITRLKRAYLPDALSPAERELLANQPLYLRAGRALRKKLYRPFKRRNRKKTWRRIRRLFRPR